MTQLHSPKKGAHPQFAAHVRCGQTAGWIKMPLGMVQASGQATFWYCGQMAGWIKMPLGMQVSLGLGDFVLDGDPALLLKKEAEPLSFRPISTVAKRSPISATAEVL